ncbi:hypothetical protein GGI12_000569 [Dipsacomyces acuminosporus]|nr:hypothetical protein GGI12_000569 [Dipsacomyces acuminosporus]
MDQTPLAAQLGIMVDLLVQEDIRQTDADDSTTGACMEYLLGNNILDELVRLAQTDAPVGIRGTVISNLSAFVNLTDDKLLVQKAVHNPILELLRSYLAQEEPAMSPNTEEISQSVASLFSSRQHAYDDDFVDLMYAICSKIRGEPMLLNIFFQDRRWLRSIEQRSTSTESIAALGRSIDSVRSSSGGQGTPTYEFLLFSHLLRFIHVEGKAGDTARTSLLFLLELATTEIMASTGGATALERFILEDSGFAAILSATLGALYSQLPRSVAIAAGPAAVVPESFPSYSADLQNAIESSIFTSASGAPGLDRWAEDRGSASTSSPEFRARLALFAHVLAFIQDVLYRCPSRTICDEVLRNLRNNFLQAILYPSLLESSDTDGSSIAVMKYLEVMLQTARHEDLVSTVMNFLTEESSSGDVHAGSSSGDSTSTSSTSRTSSSLENSSGQHKERAEPMADSPCLPFTLRDLIYTNMQSSVSNDAVISALNLLRLILSKHCRYSSRLIEVERVQPSGIANGWMTNCTVAIDVHRQELEMYASLMVQLEGTGSSSSSGRGRKSQGATAGSAAGQQTLHIPWRRDTAQCSFPHHELVRPGMRPVASDAFSIGYDEYLEDGALEWDAHGAYHAELDALIAVKSARDAEAAQRAVSPAFAQTGRNGGTSSQNARHGSKRPMRPRKYSEAVMVPERGNDTAPAALPSNKAALPPAMGSTPDAKQRTLISRQKRCLKYTVKQSDPIIRALMNLLAKYFAQPRECNLALTGVLAALVGCPYRTLDHWLGFNMAALLNGVLMKPWNVWLDNLRHISNDNSEGSGGSSDSEGEDDPRGARGFGGAPAAAIMAADASKFSGLDQELQDAIRLLPNGATPPSLYLVVNGLVHQASVLKSEVPDFARRLKRARNALMGIVEDEDDLAKELESSARPRDIHAPPNGDPSRNRDRGLSSASLEQARGASVSSTSGGAQCAAAQIASSRNRGNSIDASSVHSGIGGGRIRSNSAAHMSDVTSNSSEITSSCIAGRAAGSTAEATAASHALGIPPANANMAEFLENVIILQESIKEIIARVQVRRENGGDEDAVF